MYLVSYDTIKATRRPSKERIAALHRHLAPYGFHLVTCAGLNTTLDRITSRIWATHMAALVRHARSRDRDRPCIVIEDDVRFLYDPADLNNRLVRMIRARPDYRVIIIGALATGWTVPLGRGLALSRTPLLAHATLYSPEFCQTIAANVVFSPPYFGEVWSALDFNQRLIADPPLATQSCWPTCVPKIIRRIISIETAHKITHYAMAYGINALLVVLVAASIVLQLCGHYRWSWVTVVCLAAIVVLHTCFISLVRGDGGPINDDREAFIAAVESHVQLFKQYCPYRDR